MELKLAAGLLLALILIGCAPRASDPTITILAMGQSNAIGRDVGGFTEFSPLLTLWNNENERDDLAALGSRFVAPDLSKPPFYQGFNSIMVQAANELAMETGKHVRLILVGKGSQAISRWSGANGRKGPLYRRMVAVLSAAGVSRVDVFLWHQGEADDPWRGVSMADEYRSKWGALVTLLEGDGYITGNTPIVIGEVGDKRPEINGVLNEIAASSDRIGIAPISHFRMADGAHFDADIVDDIGRAYIDAMPPTDR